MDKLVDLFWRTGFQIHKVPAEREQRRPIEAISEVHQYALGDSFGDVITRLRDSVAPYVVFADDAVLVSDAANQTLERLLRRNRTIPGIALGTEAFGKLFPLPLQEIRTDAVRQSFLRTGWIPSWFCVLNRKLLSDNLWSGDYQSLEFLLFEVARRLRASAQGILLLDERIEFDAKFWVKDLLGQKAHALASDYARVLARNPNGTDVPPQFRIKVFGEFDPRPDTPPTWPDRAADVPKFTVICPAYKPDFLRGAVELVVEQTYPSWELRILIDGPPENDRRQILEILEDYRNDSRIVFAEQPNRGTGPTRRRLAEEARGEYLVTLDDDDMLMPKTLEVFASAAERFPEVDFFRAGARMVGLVDRYHAARPRLMVDGLSADTFEVTQPFVIRNSALHRIGGFEGDDAIKGAGEDTDLFLKLDKVGTRTVIIDRALYRRRLSLSNQSLGFTLPSALGHLKTIQDRHTPHSWVLIDRRHHEDGFFTIAILTYVNLVSGIEIICPTRYFSYQTVGDTSDRSIDLEVTSYCNAVCPFCPREVLDGKNVHMPLSIVKQVADHLRQEKAARRVVLCGIGEPTLHPNIEEIVRELCGTASELCLTTNGSLMNGALFERLVDAGLTEVNFSLNAFTAATHRRVMRLKNFDRVIRNVEEVVDSRLDRFPRVSVHVSMVLCDLNQHEAVPFLDHWRHRNVHNVWIHPLNNRAGLLSPDVKPVDPTPLSQRYADDPKIIVALLPHGAPGERICRIARDIDFISVDGNMRLCAMDYKRSTAFGNAELMNVQEMHLAKMLAYIRGDTENICRNCDFCPGARAAGAAAELAEAVS